MIKGQRLRKFALGDREEEKSSQLFQKTVSLKDSNIFLKNLQTDGIYTFIVFQIMGTVEGST